jgi:hypothetical protein
VLQDGRIFSIDTRPENAAGLALADRFNVYRSPDDDTWYDEMLVLGDRVLITGYSCDLESSQLILLRVGPGRAPDHQGTFLISSNDYYDEENYSTRLVGDSLVIYTPIWLSDIDLDEKFEWPVVRRWRPDYDPSARRADDRCSTPPRSTGRLRRKNLRSSIRVPSAR